MANTINLAKRYIPMLDEVFKRSSLTDVLNGAQQLAREGANVGEMVIPKITMDGLGKYDKATGYSAGDMSLTWETVQCNYDRSKKFPVDAMDNQETMDLAFGALAGEFTRTQVTPESDAFRLGKYATAATEGNIVEDTLSSANNVINALRLGLVTMDENEVPPDQRYLYITPTLHGMLKDMETYKSRSALESFAGIFDVPSSRFFKTITLSDTNGFSGATPLNFMIIYKPSVIQFYKHVAPKFINPNENQSTDGWMFMYHLYGIADVYENKKDGIYVHSTAPGA